MHEFINRLKDKAVNTSFLWRKTEGRPTRVPPWRPSHTTSGTRTTVWGPLFYRV